MWQIRALEELDRSELGLVVCEGVLMADAGRDQSSRFPAISVLGQLQLLRIEQKLAGVHPVSGSRSSHLWQGVSN